jgi:hypothetical protein
MPNNNIDQAVVLPSNQLPLGQVMQNAISQQERQQARQDQLEERRYETEQRNQLARQNKFDQNAVHNLGTINKYVESYQPTIQSDVSKYISNDMKEYKQFLMQNIGKNPIELDKIISEKAPVIANAYRKMQNDEKAIKEQETAFLKQMPNADPTAVREVIRNQFKSRYLGVGKDGKEFLIDPQDEGGFNYTKIFDDPAKLALVVGDNTQPLKEFFDKVQYKPLSGSEYKNNQGNVIAKKWQGLGTNYSGVVGSDENGNPKIDLDFQEIPSKNGTIKIAGETLRSDMKANPAVERTFDIAWMKKKMEKGLTNLDPATDETMKEAYRLEYARNHIKHQVNVSEIEKTPKISVTVGSNSGAKADVEIKDISEELNNAAQGRTIKNAYPISELTPVAKSILLNAARDAYGKVSYLGDDATTHTRDLNQSDIALVKRNGKNAVVLVKDGSLVTNLDEFSVNTKANKGIKAQQAVIKKEKGKAQPQAASSAYSNITETNRGTIGVKDGKWYDIKTGKPIQ